MNLLTNLKANQNQLLEAVLHSVAVEPSQAVAGQVYYNTKDKRAYVYTGTAWIAMDAKDASPTAVSIVKTINDGDSLINMDKIKDLADKLKAANIVAVINGGSVNIFGHHLRYEKVSGDIKEVTKFTSYDVTLANSTTTYDTLKRLHNICCKRCKYRHIL